MIVNKYQGNGGGSGSGYTLPTATSSRLGGVKIGSGIDVQNDGTISVSGGSADLSAYWTSGETKSYVDDEISGVTEDVSGLDERVTDIEDTMEEKEEVISRALNDLNDRKVNGDGITNIVSISQSDYDNLSVYDPSTLYIINNN